MDIILQGREIPPDLIEFFEPVDFERRGDVLRISTRPFSGAHFATYPPALVEPCVRAGASEKGCCGHRETKLELRPDLTDEERELVEQRLKEEGII